MPNRIIKESVWSSENLCRASILAQAFFMRLIPLPDDHGCFDARASILRARLYPLNYAQVTEKKIEEWIAELIAVDCIRVWVDASVRYGYFPAWNKHQQVRSLHHRKTPAPPIQIIAAEPPKTDVDNKDDSNCNQVLAVESLNPNPNPNPNPGNTGEGAAPLVALGENGWARMTEQQQERLKAELNGHADALIQEFDDWVEEAPDAKHKGVKRRERKPFLTIRAWYRRKVTEGRIQSRASPDLMSLEEREAIGRKELEAKGIRYK